MKISTGLRRPERMPSTASIESLSTLADTEVQGLAEQDEHLAKLAKALSHPARIAILKWLASLRACMCGDLVDRLPLAQSTVSQHLKVLKEAGLIKGSIEPPKTCYCLDREALSTFLTDIQDFFQNLGALGAHPFATSETYHEE
jgi:hypothetical protein